MFQQNDQYDALLAAIYDGAPPYDPYESEGQEPFDAAMNSQDRDPTNYIDLIPDVAVALVRYRREKFGDEARDPQGERLLTWLGDTFANILAFEVNES